ncbi:hypothetical protein BT93_D1333 [Corymbia citriodora subsp. variegata]|nr:hypothetical protein BT93_D1333 [Corymbia citriodora subsp. variegata]
MVHLASVSGAIHLRLRLDRLRLHLWVVSLAVGFFFFRLRRWVLGRLRRRPVLGSVRHCQHQERSSRSPQALAGVLINLEKLIGLLVINVQALRVQISPKCLDEKTSRMIRMTLCYIFVRKSILRVI